MLLPISRTVPVCPVLARIVCRLLIALALPSTARAQETHGGNRIASEGEIIPYTESYQTDGVAGYTTYKIGITMSMQAKNVYSIVGATGHASTIPAAYQVAAPFGVSTGGTNPAYWPFNDECEYDSYLTVGTDDSSASLGNIGIDFDSWTESSGISFDNGAVFSMSPNDCEPVRASATAPDVAIACVWG